MNASEYITENTEWVDNCMLWTGPTKKHGGGVKYMARFNSTNMTATRFVYTVANGVSFLNNLDGYVVATCGERRCCNPEHLYLGDHSQNMVDKAVSGNARGVSGGRPAIMTHRKLTDDSVREVFSLAYAAGARPHAVCAEPGISLSSLRERARKLGLL